MGDSVGMLNTEIEKTNFPLKTACYYEGELTPMKRTSRYLDVSKLNCIIRLATSSSKWKCYILRVKRISRLLESQCSVQTTKNGLRTAMNEPEDTICLKLA